MRIFYQAPVSRRWIRQRPHFIADGLSERGHEIFWFYAAPPGTCRSGRWSNGDGVEGLELPLVPFATRFRLAEHLNRKWIGWRLRDVRADAAIFTYPISWRWLPDHLRRLPCVFDCMDLLPEFGPPRVRKAMADAERSLAVAANAIVASSEPIARHLREDYGCEETPVEIVPNAARIPELSGAKPVPGLARPSLVYVGTIDAWFDWDSILSAARNHPEWSFELVGPVVARPEEAPGNIHFHGPVPHEAVADWLVSADVLLIPFVRNRLIDAVDPVKMYEYLAAGRPIVSSWWPLLARFSKFPAVSFYRVSDDAGMDGPALRSLEEAVLESLSGPERFAPPRDFLRENGWPARIDRFEAIVSGLNRSFDTTGSSVRT